MGTQTLQYTLTLSNWRANEFSVSLFIPKHDKNELLLTLPSWIPGSYMVRDFAKSIVTLSAVSDVENSSLPIEKIDKLLHPNTIGIIGISSKKINIGRIILQNILLNQIS